MKSKLYLFLTTFGLATCGLQAIEPNVQAPLQFTSQREQDLNDMLQEDLLMPEVFDKMMGMFVGAAIAENKKDCSSDKILESLHQKIDTLEVRRQLMQPYEMFSDEEIHQLREIYATPVFKKYRIQGMPIIQAQLQVLQDLISKSLEQEKDLVSTGEEQSDTILKLTQENFSTEVELAAQPVIIDVYATWCGPCQALAPHFKVVSQQYQEACKFAKIDGDQQKELVERLCIKGYPTLLFMYKGQLISKEMGFMTQEALAAKVQQFLEKIQTLKQ